MKKSLLVTITLIIMLTGLLVAVYDIDLNSEDPCYDITLTSRRNHNYGFGLTYSGGFSLSRFFENVHGGCAEQRIFPPFPDIPEMTLEEAEVIWKEIVRKEQVRKTEPDTAPRR